MKRLLTSALTAGINTEVTTTHQAAPQRPINAATHQGAWRRRPIHRAMPKRTTPVSSRTNGINKAANSSNHQRRSSSPNSSKNTSSGSWQRSWKLHQVGPITAWAP